MWIDAIQEAIELNLRRNRLLLGREGNQSYLSETCWTNKQAVALLGAFAKPATCWVARANSSGAAC
jgi:hypothetical protein